MSWKVNAQSILNKKKLRFWTTLRMRNILTLDFCCLPSFQFFLYLSIISISMEIYLLLFRSFTPSVFSLKENHTAQKLNNLLKYRVYVTESTNQVGVDHPQRKVAAHLYVSWKRFIIGRLARQQNSFQHLFFKSSDSFLLLSHILALISRQF